MEHKAVYRKYQEQKPKRQPTFAEKHHTKISLFESAERYLKGVMNGKTTLPVKSWKAERDKLANEKSRLTQEYTSLKEETRVVEQIKQSVYSLVCDQTQRAYLQQRPNMK